MELLFYPHHRKLPAAVTRQDQVVVFDVLRATTTITAALASGISAILPCGTLTQARRTARTWTIPGRPTRLAGERRGLKPPGFDYGNSPLEFSRRMQGRLVMTTSNGTRALQAARPAALVLAVCLNNLSAAVAYTRKRSRGRLIVLAAGEQGRSSEEDTVIAGLFIQTWLQRRTQPGLSLNPGAAHACRLAQGIKNTESFLLSTPHGRELRRLGYTADVRFAAQRDSTRVLGQYKSGVIKKTPR